MPETHTMQAVIAEISDHGLEKQLMLHDIRVSRAADAQAALNILAVQPTDLLFADALLPGMEGAALLKIASGMRTGGVRPGCALMCVSGYPASAPGFPVLYRPFSDAALTDVIQSLLPENRVAEPALCECAEALLMRLGVPEHIGRQLLKQAILAAYNDVRLASQLSARLYPAMSLRSGLTARQAERAVRHVIDRTWQEGPAEAQYELFGNTIDAQRGKPGVGAMIARCADILRLEAGT